MKAVDLASVIVLRTDEPQIKGSPTWSKHKIFTVPCVNARVHGLPCILRKITCNFSKAKAHTQG